MLKQLNIQLYIQMTKYLKSISKTKWSEFKSKYNLSQEQFKHQQSKIPGYLQCTN